MEKANKCATLTKTINIQYIASTVHHYSEYTKISKVESYPLLIPFLYEKQQINDLCMLGVGF